MTTEGAYADTIKQDQAINIDYPNTNYDRGHLNPNFYQCDESRTATFTLTNAVPQDPCFNQQMWKNMERKAKESMESHCNFPGANRYFVTGAVPSYKTIPSPLHDEEGDQPRDYNRVNVPSAMWTAVCCDSSNAYYFRDIFRGFSFGYYGENVPDSLVIPYMVSELESELKIKYRISTLKIFADSCFSSSETSWSMLRELSIPLQLRVAEILDHISESGESSVRPEKRQMLNTINENMHRDSDFAMKNLMLADADFGLLEKRNNIQQTRDWLAKYKMTAILTCPSFTKAFAKLTNKASVNTERLNWNRKDEYMVVQALESTLSASLSRCRQDHRCDYHDKSYTWCYIDWSDYWDYCCVRACGFEQQTSYAWCYTSMNNDWYYCAERSSMISVTGRQCRADHECGSHGEAYHWCYTDTNDNWDYCCQPWHECANHGESYKWCYTGFKKQSGWKYCEY